MTDLALATLTAVAQRIQARDLSPVELTRHLLDRIASHDQRFHSYVTVLDEQAIAQASAAEADIIRGRYRGPLHGIPVAVKDLCCTTNIPTTCGAQS
jgi:Asp-tRNA(Asn)/Glu-tRNA(Gln) amidotransferase A subunit family amidase